MKSLRHIISLVFIVMLASCTKQWSLDIVRWNATTGPVFCLGERGQCGERGVQMHVIYVSEVSSNESSGGAVWQIQNVSDNAGQATLTSLTYGEVPKGWSEVKKAGHLLPNVYYSINEEYYFVCDGNYKYSVLSREQYFSRRFAVSTHK